MFVIVLDLVGNPFVLLAKSGRLLAVCLRKRIRVLSLPHLLFFLGDFEGPDVLQQFALFNAVPVFIIFKRYLLLFLQRRQFVEVLEHQMLQLLLHYLNRYLVLLLQVLELAFFVAEFGLLVFELFLCHEPKIVDP